MNDQELLNIKDLKGCYPGEWAENALKTVFKVIEESEKTSEPVLVVLPTGINPASLATTYALQCLTKIGPPPTPHCKIALAPGAHFTSDLNACSYSPHAINRLWGKARVKSSYQQLTNVYQKLLKRIRSNQADQDVKFHWLWACRYLYKVYNKFQYEIISPRDYFGRDDNYESVIDLLMGEECERTISVNHQYDLLVYCPFYKSINYNDWNSNFEHVLRTLSSFKAHRKLIVLRSPYDMWAKALESKLGYKGYSCISMYQQQDSQGTLDIQIVENVIGLRESFELYESIKRLWLKARNENTETFLRLKDDLKRLLVSLEPLNQNDYSLIVENIKFLAAKLSQAAEEDSSNLINKLNFIFSDQKQLEKIEYLKAMSKDRSLNVWISRKTDYWKMLDICAKNDLNLKFTYADRKMKFLNSYSDAPNVIVNIDRATDLDLVAYLKPGDALILSAWEVIVRANDIEKLWERSNRWKENAIKIGALVGKPNEFDPVNLLKERIRAEIESIRAVVHDELSQNNSDLSKEGTSENNWWEQIHFEKPGQLEFYKGSIKEDKDGVLCKEVLFEDGIGCFLNSETLYQIFREGKDESEDEVGLRTALVSEMKSGDILVYCKDQERGTLLDLLFDSLESSSKFSDEAQKVKKFKELVNTNFQKRFASVSDFEKKFKGFGGDAQVATIKTWLNGSVMGPRDDNNTEALCRTFEIPENEIFEIKTSLKVIRKIHRVTGKVLTNFLVGKDLDQKTETGIEKLIIESGFDFEEIRNSVERRKIVDISEFQIFINPINVMKFFRA